jgi:hypothetical protein
LKTIKKAKSSTPNKMLQNKDLLHCICGCALNILKDNVPLTQSQFKKLQQHKYEIKKLASNLVSDKQKVKIMQDGEELLGKIITPALNQLTMIEEQKYEMDRDGSSGSDSMDDNDDSCISWSSYDGDTEIKGSETDTEESSDTAGESEEDDDESEETET